MEIAHRLNQHIGLILVYLPLMNIILKDCWTWNSPIYSLQGIVIGCIHVFAMLRCMNMVCFYWDIMIKDLEAILGFDIYCWIWLCAIVAKEQLLSFWRIISMKMHMRLCRSCVNNSVICEIINWLRKLMWFGSSLRGISGYWKMCRYELTDMITYLGCFTFFFTLNATDTKWLDLHCWCPQTTIIINKVSMSKKLKILISTYI